MFESRTNINNITSWIPKINGIRVNKLEIVDLIKRGLCFDNQNSFDDFLRQVSKCSLKYHKYLAEGINVYVNDSFKSTSIKFKIPLVRRKNRNYIVLGNREYNVANTNTLINIEKSSSIDEVINKLLNPGIVRIDGPDDIRFIIREGENEYKESLERSEKLLEDTEKLFGLNQTHIDHDGTDYKGYMIHGSDKTYFLAVDLDSNYENSAKVFEYPSMKYLCVVDKSVDRSVSLDRVVSRIYALHNDSLIAKDINTL